MSSYSSDRSNGVNLNSVTSESLAHFDRRRKLLLLLRGAAAGVVVFASAMLIIALCDYLWLMSDSIRWCLSVCAYLVTLAAIWHFGLRRFHDSDPRSLARQMESTAPSLRDDLLSAVELSNPRDANGSPVFRQRLQGRVARHVSALDIGNLLPMALIRRWLSTGLLVAAVCLVLLLIPSMQFGRRFARAMLPGVPIERASRTKVTIVEPSPATGYVAEGDAVAVIVEISGEETNEVLLVWRTEDGVEGETIMTPRVRPVSVQPDTKVPSTTTATIESEDTIPVTAIDKEAQTTIAVGNVFAANLSVGTVPVEYQIHAGDAITLWNILTPLPRPRTKTFQKRYVFPSYASLADRIEEDEHGDLQAIVGTMAKVNVEFDEPVKNAVVRYGNRGVEINLLPADDSQVRYIASIPIKTAAQYQVDATSIKSGLSNPFSPSYSINPVVDAPPVVNWTNPQNDLTLVSPLNVMSLSGSVQDDLPVDRLIQEFRVNGGPIQEHVLSVEEPRRQFRTDWSWDLMHRFGVDKKPTAKLAAGDLLQTRLVAIDRRGNRGETKMIDFLIADGFDANRHDHIDELAEVVGEVLTWTKASQALAEQLKKAASDREFAPESALDEELQNLHTQTPTVIETIAGAMESSRNVVDTNTFELAGRAIIAMDAELEQTLHSLNDAIPDTRDVWKTSREKHTRKLAYESLRVSHQARRVDTLARGVLSQTVSIAVARDALALKDSIQPLLDADSGVPVSRFGRYLNVVLARMSAVDDLVDKYGQSMLDTTRSHFESEKWRRWAERWRVQIERTIKNPPRDDSYRALIRSFDDQLTQKIRTEMIDNRLPQLFNDAFKDARRELRTYRDVVREIRQRGYDARRASEKAEKESDTKKVAEANRDAKYEKAAYLQTRKLLATRLNAESNLHRRRSRVDLQYAADLGLLQRAIANVNQSGFVPYRDEPPEQVHDHIGDAMRVLEAVHEAHLMKEEFALLANAEQEVTESPDSRLNHSLWLERYHKSMEWPVRTLQAAGLDWNKTLDGLDKTRHNSDFSAARDRITRRRWERNDVVSAEVPLAKLRSQIQEGFTKLQPHVIAARETVLRYVLTLPEQARQAAKKAQEAKERTDKRADSEKQTTENLAEKQKDAEQAAKETVQSLIDKANTADITDDAQRELSRDADAAAATVQDATEKAQQAMKQAENATDETKRNEALEKAENALDQLKNTLEKTADHFEKAENGDDVAESRQELRQAEEMLNIDQELDERYEDAEAMAEAAKSDPRELLKQLEEELKRNEPMQEELSEISENAAESAQRSLERSERDEKELNQSLERSDNSLQEEKRRIAQKMQELADRAKTVKDHMLSATAEAAAWANDQETRKSAENARKETQKAADISNELGGENALAEKMRQAASEMKKAIEQAINQSERAQQKAAEASKQDLHKDQKARENAQRSMEAKSRTQQNRILQELNRQRTQWSRKEQEANRRVQQAQREERDARNDRQRAEEQLKKAKEPNDAQRRQVDQQKQREKNAQRAEDAAQESRKFAQDQRKAIEEKARDLKKKRQPRLDRPNPAAQLAEETAKQAAEELKQIQQELSTIAKDIPDSSSAQTPPQQAENLSREQGRINDEVENAADQVARASRHEKRLGNENMAQELQKAAQSIDENGLLAGEQAKQALEQTAKQNTEKRKPGSPAETANQKVSEATEKIGQEANKLAEMLQRLRQNETQDGQPQQGEPQQSQQVAQQQNQPRQNQPQQGKPQSGEPTKSQQLAQTLDELDRAIAASEKQQASDPQGSDQPQQPSQTQPQQSGQQQPSGQQESGQQQQANSGTPPDQQPGQTQSGQQQSGDVSPTLAQMLDSQQQQSARQRQQQMQQQGKPGEGNKPGQEPDGSKQGDTPAENASLNMPDDPDSFLPNALPGEMGQWGQLRERRTDDAGESRSTRIAPQYRREVEAYFKAIAKRAAEKIE